MWLQQILLDIQWHDLINPKFYIQNGGLWLLLFIIFAETGLFVGFFLPGDSLLFVAGIFSNDLAAYLYNTNSDFLNLMLIGALVSAAGILGNAVGYWFGKKIGPTMYTWNDNLLFKKKYLFQANPSFLAMLNQPGMPMNREQFIEMRFEGFGGSLEDAFLALTGRAARDAEASPRDRIVAFRKRGGELTR